jgi:hypothetical protein
MKDILKKNNIMIAMLSMEFEYREKLYAALVRVKKINDNIEYHLTIMNGDLEKLLYGWHIFKEEQGRFVPCRAAEKGETAALQSTVCNALYASDRELIVGN